MDELNQSKLSTVAFVTLINLNYLNDNISYNVLPCPHTNCSHYEQSMIGPPPSPYTCSVHCAPTDTWPQLNYHSRSTCIFEYGTPSWACWNIFYMMKKKFCPQI